MYLVVCNFNSSYTGSSSVAKEPHPLLYPVLIKQRIPPSHCLDVLDKIFQLSTM